jgi:hypothetical protein
MAEILVLTCPSSAATISESGDALGFRMDKFNLFGNTLTLLGPLSPDERQMDEEAFLAGVDKLLGQKNPEIVIDLVRAGNLSSTLIALVIAASRKAEAVKKKTVIRTGKRNGLAIRISGLERLVEVRLV